MCGGIVVAGIVLMAPVGQSKNTSTTSTSTTTREQCCTEFKNVYDPSPKHGKEGRWTQGGKWISPAPVNGQAALNNSVPAGRSRVGLDPTNGDIVQFRLTRRDEVNCIDYWHGYVVSNQPVAMNTSVRRAAEKAGFFPQK